MTAIHIDTHSGICTNKFESKQITNIFGRDCWKVTVEVSHLFGCEVCMEPIVGYGLTKEQAINRVYDEMKKLCDSFWLE